MSRSDAVSILHAFTKLIYLITFRLYGWSKPTNKRNVIKQLLNFVICLYMNGEKLFISSHWKRWQIRFSANLASDFNEHYYCCRENNFQVDNIFCITVIYFVIKNPSFFSVSICWFSLFFKAMILLKQIISMLYEYENRIGFLIGKGKKTWTDVINDSNKTTNVRTGE